MNKTDKKIKKNIEHFKYEYVYENNYIGELTKITDKVAMNMTK